MNWKQSKHWLAHKFGWNYGQVISKFDEDGNLWIAHQCSTCHSVNHAHICEF